jgi:uncharacterized protein YjbI with pentapeptide repeats
MWKLRDILLSIAGVGVVGGGIGYLTLVGKGIETAKTAGETKKAFAESAKADTETVIQREKEIRERQLYISSLYKNATSKISAERQDAIDNLVKYTENRSDDRLKAVNTLAQQIGEENSISGKPRKKTKLEAKKTQILLNAIINISAVGEDLRDNKKPNHIGLNSVNLYDSVMTSDVKNNKVKLYLSFANSYIADSTLNEVDLTKANLVKADLSGSGLRGTILSSANLTDVKLVGTDLLKADLTRANLTRANLTRANLTRANLTEADFSGSVGINPKQIAKACYWKEAKGIVGKSRPQISPSQEKIDECNAIWNKK